MTDSAEDIQLPERIKACSKGIDGDALVGEAGNLLLTVFVGNVGRDYWVAIQLSFVVDGAGLAKPGASDPDGSVRCQRLLHQRVEHRIIELLPPLSIDRRIAHQLRISGVIGNRRRLRRLVMWPHGTPRNEKQKSNTE